MRYLPGLVVSLFVGMAACAVDPITEDTGSSVRSSELSSSVPESAKDTGTTTQSFSCTDVWECDEICGVVHEGVLIRYSTNVLHRYCDDGSDTVVLTHPCGEACF